MEFLSPPSTSPYVTAPTSPTSYMVQYHSAPASPGKRFGRTTTDENYELTLSDFEFETSKKFDNCLEFETCENVEHSEDNQSWHEKRRERGGSLPEMAFADEIFSNGQVMPLKLPPRLQCDNDMKYTTQRSITCSTIAPSAMVKSPFARRDVDPFVVAMQKVMKEENRGRSNNSNHHKRARSLSPFRAKNMEWTIEEMRQEIVSMTPIQPSSPNPRKPIESKAKGASYGRWVLDHSMTIGPVSKVSKKPKNLLFGKKDPEPKPNKPPSNGIAQEYSSKGDVFVETKMQKFKGMLVKYASFRKENSEGKINNPISAIWKPNYFKKLSFKFKGNSNGNVSKKVNGGEPKLVIVKYKPALCLGYGLEKA